MNFEETVASPPDLERTKRDSTLKTLWDLYFSPLKAFKSLSIRPRWLIPFIICTLVTIIYTVIIWDTFLEDKIINLQSDQSLSTTEIDRRVANLERQQQGNLANMHIQSFLIGVSFITIGQATNLFALSSVIWLALHLLAPHVHFKSILAVCSFSMLVIIPETILKTPLILYKNTMKVYLGLAAFLPSQWESSPLFNMFREIDIFSVWTIVLLIIGITVVTGIPRKKVIVTIGYLWGVWLLLSLFLGEIVLFGIS